MAYKTVLVHCNDKGRIDRLLAAALGVAAPFQAHLVGVSVAPPVVVIPAGMPGSPDTLALDEHCKAYRQDNPAMKALFEAAARSHNLVAEWREGDAASSTVADVVLEHARAADLVIAAQTASEWPGSGHLDIAERLVTGSGRPVLVVPNEGPQSRIGTKVLVAWNGRREAARAAFDALPLLTRAAEVGVVWVNPQAEGQTAQDIPAADICTALARHNVKCEATQTMRPHADVGRTLLAYAEESGADLLVMGCYGHSRLREFVLGGASEHVLAHMRLPVLMSH
jgi:nucleotide-binding universal stress UspA family protein